jgi:lysophospholipase L1-like esterase
MRCSLFIIIFFTLLSCQKSAAVGGGIKKDSTSITWLALGDSYTIGESVSMSDRFPAQSLELLKQKSVRTEKLTYIAKTGWTSANLEQTISDLNPTPHDIVTLLIGVNDQFQGIDTGTYSRNFRSILNRAINLTQGANENVIVLSIPDYSVTPFSKNLDTAKISREIDTFNSINYRITQEYNCNYIYITDLTREAKSNRLLIAYDSLHPSAIAYKQWAEKLNVLIGKKF